NLAEMPHAANAAANSLRNRRAQAPIRALQFERSPRCPHSLAQAPREVPPKQANVLFFTPVSRRCTMTAAPENPLLTSAPPPRMRRNSLKDMLYIIPILQS